MWLLALVEEGPSHSGGGLLVGSATGAAPLCCMWGSVGPGHRPAARVQGVGAAGAASKLVAPPPVIAALPRRAAWCLGASRG